VIQPQPDQRGLTERYTDEALQFIRANREQPFFLYLAHMYVHVPLFVPKPFLEKSRNGAYGGAVECIDWSTGVTRAIDLFPTFGSAAGVAEPPALPIDGEDLMPVLRGEADAPKSDTSYYYLHHQLEAVRVGDWKLHFGKGSHHEPHRSDMKELYDLPDMPTMYG